MKKLLIRAVRQIFGGGFYRLISFVGIIALFLNEQYQLGWLWFAYNAYRAFSKYQLARLDTMRDPYALSSLPGVTAEMCGIAKLQNMLIKVKPLRAQIVEGAYYGKILASKLMTIDDGNFFVHSLIYKHLEAADCIAS